MSKPPAGTYWVIEHATRGVLQSCDHDGKKRRAKFSYTKDRSEGMIFYFLSNARKQLRIVHEAGVKKAYILELGKENGHFYAREAK